MGALTDLVVLILVVAIILVAFIIFLRLLPLLILAALVLVLIWFLFFRQGPRSSVAVTVLLVVAGRVYSRDQLWSLL